MILLDTTLRDGLMSENVALSLKEKIQIASLLDQAGIERIEMAHIHGSDFREALTVGKEISEGKVCVLTDTGPKNLQNAIDFTQKIRGGVIHIYSMANMPYNELDTRLQEIKTAVCMAKDHVDTVQWTGFDGNRAAYRVLHAQIATAIESGAKTISIPDSMGVHSPDGFESLVRRVIEDFNSQGTRFSVHCHDDLGHALENTMAGISAGVHQAELTLAGVGARKGNCNLIDLIRNKKLLSKYDQERLRQAEDILLAATTVD